MPDGNCNVSGSLTIISILFPPYSKKCSLFQHPIARSDNNPKKSTPLRSITSATDCEDLSIENGTNDLAAASEFSLKRV